MEKTENLQLPIMEGRDHFDFLTDWNDSMRTIDSSYKALNTVAEGLNGSTVELRESVQSISEALSALKEQVDKLDEFDQTEMINQLKSDLTALTERVDTMDGELQTNNASIAAISSHLEIIDSSINSIRTNVATLLEAVESHSEKFVQLDGKVEEFEQAITTINTQINNIDGSLQNLNTKIELLEKHSVQNTANIQELNEKTTQLQTDVTTAAANALTAENNAAAALRNNARRIAHMHFDFDHIPMKYVSDLSDSGVRVSGRFNVDLMIFANSIYYSVNYLSNYTVESVPSNPSGNLIGEFEVTVQDTTLTPFLESNQYFTLSNKGISNISYVAGIYAATLYFEPYTAVTNARQHRVQIMTYVINAFGYGGTVIPLLSLQNKAEFYHEGEITI